MGAQERQPVPDLTAAREALEKNAQKVGFDGLENADYFINGKAATSDEVHALGPEKIAMINVVKKALASLDK